jgi:hypothetical protein
MVVTGYDDRTGCGYVLSTGPDATPTPGARPVTHELAATLRDALTYRAVALLGWSGPEVPLTLDDRTVLAWLRHTVGGVLTVAGGPGPDPRVAGR